MSKIRALAIITASAIFSGITALSVFASDISSQNEQYFLSKIKNNKIGYISVIQKEKVSDGKLLIITDRYSENQFKRLGYTVKASITTQYIEDKDGKPVSFTSIIEGTGEDTKIKGEFTDKKLNITTEINGLKKTEEINLYNKKILFPSAIEKLFKDNPEKNLIEYFTVDPATGGRIISVSSEKVSTEKIPTLSAVEEFFKYKTIIDLLPNVENFEWRNSKGKIVREISSIFDMEEIAVNKDKIFDATGDSDLFYQSLIPVETVIKDPFNLEEASYKIETKNISPEDIFVNDERQRVIQIKGNIVYLKVKNEANKDKFKYPFSTKGYSEYLKSGPYIMLNDEEIKNQALSLVKSEKDAYQISKKLEKWVYENITNKDFSVNFANASYVYKQKTGDCTEHSILLASMLRAVGIPSKVVVGLLYSNSPEKAFVYHMWVKAYVGKWVNLDPSFPNANFTPTHIALYESPLNNLNDKTDIILKVIKSLSSFKIDVLDYTDSLKQTSKEKQDTLPVNENSGLSFINIFKNSSEGTNNLNTTKLNGDGLNKISLNGKSDGLNKIGLTKGGNETTNMKLNGDSSETNEIGLSVNQAASGTNNLNIEEKTPDYYINLGLYDYAAGRISQARTDFENAIKNLPYNDDFSYINLSVKLASLGLFDLSEKCLKNIQDSQIWSNKVFSIKKIYFPKVRLNTNTETLLAEAVSKIDFQKSYDEALNSLKQNKKSYDKYDWAHFILAKAYASKKQYKNSINEFYQALKINPENLNYRLELARVFIQKKDYNSANAQLDFIFNSSVKDKEFFRLANSELLFIKSQKNKGDKVKSQYFLAQYYQNKGEIQTSADILNKLVEKKRVSDFVYQELGDVNLIQNNLKKAETHYREALKLNKRNYKSYLGLGNIFIQENQFKDALSQYKQADRINSEDIDVTLAMGKAYRYLSQEELSYKYFDKVLNIDSANITANYNMGIIALNQKELLSAESYIKKSLASDPYFVSGWMALAKIYFEKQNYYLSKMYLSAVNYLSPNNAEYYYNMGLIEKSSENYSLSAEYFQKALELNQGLTQASQELSKLSN